jgi:hypothetical protein
MENISSNFTTPPKSNLGLRISHRGKFKILSDTKTVIDYHFLRDFWNIQLHRDKDRNLSILTIERKQHDYSITKSSYITTVKYKFKDGDDLNSMLVSDEVNVTDACTMYIADHEFQFHILTNQTSKEASSGIHTRSSTKQRDDTIEPKRTDSWQSHCSKSSKEIKQNDVSEPDFTNKRITRTLSERLNQNQNMNSSPDEDMIDELLMKHELSNKQQNSNSKIMNTNSNQKLLRESPVYMQQTTLDFTHRKETRQSYPVDNTTENQVTYTIETRRRKNKLLCQLDSDTAEDEEIRALDKITKKRKSNEGMSQNMSLLNDLSNIKLTDTSDENLVRTNSLRKKKTSYS